MSVAEWLDYLTVVRTMSPNTVAGYGRALKTLPDAPTASREDVEA